MDAKNAMNMSTPVLDDPKFSGRRIDTKEKVRLFQEKRKNKNKATTLGSNRDLNYVSR